ncbi:MAG: hypothetical protein ACFFDN_17760 [Candidatus Hodarchaeota archaeon]
MKAITNRTFRITYLVGLIFLFFSIFLEWYCFQIFNLDNELIVSWNYNLFFGWITPFPSSFTLNGVMRPENTTIPLIMNILFLSSIIISGYVVLFKDVSNAVDIKKYNKYAYFNGFVLLIVFSYIIISPVLYLIPYELYFPLLNIRNYDAGFIFLYTIGPGYILQLFSFPLLFPYSVFYYQTVTLFRQEDHTPEKIVDNLINKAQEPLDLDKFIAEEELKQKFDTPEEDIYNIVTTFIEGDKEL